MTQTPVDSRPAAGGTARPATLRTGAEYRASLRDGRRVWVLGGHRITDVTTDPLTRGVVDSFAEWYDRHQDPAWADVLLRDGEPLAYRVPRTAEDLVALGRSVRDVAFEHAGNLTHPPSYGAMITLGVLDCVQRMGQPAEFVARARAWRDEVAARQLFVTMGANPIPGDRFRPPAQRNGVRVVGRDADGIIVSGMVGLHTATPFVDEVFVLGGIGPTPPDHRVMFATPVAAPGVRVVARQVSTAVDDEFVAPLSRRFDELDAQLWLDEVRVPWDRVFALEYEMPIGRPEGREFDTITPWMLWHQQLGWLARQEFTLGLCFAVADAMGLLANSGVVSKIVNAVVQVEGVSNAAYAAEHDPWTSAHGYARPNLRRLAPGAIESMRQRDALSGLVRGLIGQAGMLTPTERDLADPDIGPGLELAFGGGRYTARQRAALLQFASDHAASALDTRESSFEAHANGGVHTWLMHAQRWYGEYTSAANRVLGMVGADGLPAVDLDAVRDPAFGPGGPPPGAGPGGAPAGPGTPAGGPR